MNFPWVLIGWLVVFPHHGFGTFIPYDLPNKHHFNTIDGCIHEGRKMARYMKFPEKEFAVVCIPKGLILEEGE